MTIYPNLTKEVIKRIGDKYNLKKEFRLSKNNDLKSFKADVFIKLENNYELFLEIEETQNHPDTNVSKYWMYLDKKPDIKIILLQFFGRTFIGSKNNYLSRRELCRFIAKKMNDKLRDRFEYIELNRNDEYSLEKYKTPLGEIAQFIVEQVETQVKKYDKREGSN